MSSVVRLFVMGVTMAVFWSPTFSSQVVNQARQNNASMFTKNVVERGGTVEAVSIENKTITVDGHTYGLASASIIIHGTNGKDSQGLGSLRPGSKVRFNTTRNNYAGRDRVIEIWISDVGRVSNKK